jgi:hypothetical protein
MADQNTSLPVRSQADGTDERLHVKIVDGTNSPAVNQTEVDSDNNLHVEIHGNDPASTDRVVRTSELGALTPDGVYDVANNTIPGNVGVIASVRDAAPSDTTQTQRLTAVTNGTKRLLDVSIHDENGAVFSASNPLPVTSVDSEGTEVNDYNTAAAVAAAASSNHDYTVTAATTLKLSSIWAAASGKMKIQVQVETAVASNTFTTRFVGFNSTANPNISVPIGENISVAAGVRVRVIRTNLDNQAQDLYSTISGHEIA